MESRAYSIYSKADKELALTIVPGHFATSHSHVNYYIDMTALKTHQKEARKVAQLIAHELISIDVDTIVCMDSCEVVGAFVADEISSDYGVNKGKTISIVTPECDSNRNMIFRDNIQRAIFGKKILVLLASTTTGKTARRVMECCQYYGGSVSRVASIFSAIDSIEEVPIVRLFDETDVPSYQTFKYSECPYCAAHQKIDALVNGHGYSKL